MLLKIIPIIVTTLRLVGNTNIANADSQAVIMEQLQAVINQLMGNKQELENKLNKIKILKIKMLLIKRFTKKDKTERGFNLNKTKNLI